ncbi:MAG: ABC-type phosphate transport system substrate-binding protein [Oceanicoccus sp.]|jgi:ABC-type phosphate transport system substrate-binding protein
MKILLSSFVLTSSLLLSAFATADVEVIVHPSNGAALDQDAIQRIFLGKTRAFPGGGEAVAISASEGSPEELEFTEKVLSKSPKQLKAYWAKMVFTGKGTPPRQVDSTAELVKLISANPNLIGFIPAGTGGGGVKVVGKF